MVGVACSKIQTAEKLKQLLHGLLMKQMSLKKLSELVDFGCKAYQ
jgi:hypothetical protein